MGCTMGYDHVCAMCKALRTRATQVLHVHVQRTGRRPDILGSRRTRAAVQQLGRHVLSGCRLCMSSTLPWWATATATATPAPPTSSTASCTTEEKHIYIQITAVAILSKSAEENKIACNLVHNLQQEGPLLRHNMPEPYRSCKLHKHGIRCHSILPPTPPPPPPQTHTLSVSLYYYDMSLMAYLLPPTHAHTHITHPPTIPCIKGIKRTCIAGGACDKIYRNGCASFQSVSQRASMKTTTNL